MITIISLLFQVQSICTDFTSFGHKIEWIEIEGIRIDPCEVRETDSEIIQLQKILEANKQIRVDYKTDLKESYFFTTIGGE